MLDLSQHIRKSSTQNTVTMKDSLINILTEINHLKQSVISEVKENIGYLRLRSFNEKSGDELIDKIKEIKRMLIFSFYSKKNTIVLTTLALRMYGSLGTSLLLPDSSP